MGCGNKREQRRRRRKNNKHTEKQDLAYQLIDGNMSYYPHGYCNHYTGFLTKNMALRHSCESKQCRCFELFDKKKVII